MDRTHKQTKKIVKLLPKIGFREPYQVIVEDSFVAAMKKYMLGLRHVNDLLRSQPKLFVTKCVYKAHRDVWRGYRHGISKYLEILNCCHQEPRSPLDCLRRVMRKSNKNHYILASNCSEITGLICLERRIPTITCQRGSLLMTADLQAVPMHKGLSTEAGQEELSRLEALFPSEDKE